MIDGIFLVGVGGWVLLIGLGKVRVSKSPTAGAAWLEKWGLVFKIGGPVLIVIGIVQIAAGLAR
jgi:hypothetical protein